MYDTSNYRQIGEVSLGGATQFDFQMAAGNPILAVAKRHNPFSRRLPRKIYLFDAMTGETIFRDSVRAGDLDDVLLSPDGRQLYIVRQPNN
ncbi:MAG: hypothetical protein CNE99_07080 [OM182 bacterium MED-G24]|uniref:Uncharacterized protein n=1 Tax=OM182 bacterium MED-G24 TaxID=1986255 RepID=A0A2A5WQF6_9GAMM|nr:MAG: hypothetical protein CNE99_07080 [OM182 bacterium MED-G24]